MIVDTTRFGAIEVDEKCVLRMPRGPYGFEERREFVLLEHSPDSLFRWLQSADDPALAFVVMEPSACITGYEIEITDADAETLRLERAEDAMALVILTIAEGGARVTANLAAPIVINAKLSIGMQMVLDDSRYAPDQTILDSRMLPEVERSAA